MEGKPWEGCMCIIEPSFLPFKCKPWNLIPTLANQGWLCSREPNIQKRQWDASWKWIGLNWDFGQEDTSGEVKVKQNLAVSRAALCSKAHLGKKVETFWLYLQRFLYKQSWCTWSRVSGNLAAHQWVSVQLASNWCIPVLRIVTPRVADQKLENRSGEKGTKKVIGPTNAARSPNVYFFW